MDPNATLQRLRELCSEAIDLTDVDPDELEHSPDRDEALECLAGEIAELFQALDGWLSNGGFKPSAWQRQEK